ncbi:hypothetical protein ARMGADRAFT_1161404 [Armillaria gallica]|uniref:Reverse transcriptase zinc-binding domain-containing protein n=1 Tax=Armillaria gallica TaxID=47427 RepID=A0A2H3DX60_ARMGA|nr:hypothetical protein ARMGADRAFT_1161404 [Armillaria gallica]
MVPLYHRRLILALRYLRYLLSLPEDYYAYLTLQKSLALRRSHLSSWFGDMQRVLARLAPTVHIDYDTLSEPIVTELIIAVERACLDSINDEINSKTKGAILRLAMRYIPGVHGLQPQQMTLARRAYLSVLIPAHRKALTCLFLSSHVLAVEVLRWSERYRPRIPRDWRLCRYCKIAMEDEMHCLLRCTIAPGLVELHGLFLADIHAACPMLGDAWNCLDDEDRLACLLQLPTLDSRLAQYVHHVLEIFRAAPVYVPPLSLWYTPL